jgi:hypothetical protein
MIWRLFCLGFVRCMPRAMPQSMVFAGQWQRRENSSAIDASR